MVLVDADVVAALVVDLRTFEIHYRYYDRVVILVSGIVVARRSVHIT